MDEQTGSGTSEEIAYRLYRDILELEEKDVTGKSGKPRPSRKWLLATYAECLEAVRQPEKARISKQVNKTIVPQDVV